MSMRAGVWTVVFLSVVAVGCLASTAHAAVIADWEFNSSADLLVDSSYNGHTLVNNGNVTWDAGSEVFSGNGILATIDAINLVPYTKIRVSWSELVTSAAATQVVWEQMTNYGNHIGAIGSFLDDVGGGHWRCGA